MTLSFIHLGQEIYSVKMLKPTRKLFSILLLLSVVNVNAVKDNTETSTATGFHIEWNNDTGESTWMGKLPYDEQSKEVQEDLWCENERLEIADEIDYLSAYMKEVADDLAMDGVRIAVEETRSQDQDIATWKNEKIPCNYSDNIFQYVESSSLPQYQV